MHSLPDCHCEAAENANEELYRDDAAVRDEIMQNMQRIFSANVLVSDCEGNYRRVNALLHTALNHCDQLSFEFFYDGQWLILDSEGGAGGLADFAQSSPAHSALLCDEKLQDYLKNFTLTEARDRCGKFAGFYIRHYIGKICKVYGAI
jgi:hypothetical protein